MATIINKILQTSFKLAKKNHFIVCTSYFCNDFGDHGNVFNNATQKKS